MMISFTGLLWRGHRVRQNVRIILYFLKDFEECVLCIKELHIHVRQESGAPQLSSNFKNDKIICKKDADMFVEITSVSSN